MSTLSTAIRALDDDSAKDILAAVAERRLQPGDGAVTEITPELMQALAGAVGGAGDTASATEGELARSTLVLLAEDPARQGELQALVGNPQSARTFAVEPITFAILSTATLIALQTHVEISYDRKSGWKIVVKKMPTTGGLLGQIVGVLKHLALHS
jgi:hypothetical protein